MKLSVDWNGLEIEDVQRIHMSGSASDTVVSRVTIETGPHKSGPAWTALMIDHHNRQSGMLMIVQSECETFEVPARCIEIVIGTDANSATLWI